MPDKKIFLDTNIIVYAYDTSAGKKHKKAKDIMIDLWNSGNGVVSTQVLQEFFVTVTQKLSQKLDLESAKSIINGLLKWNLVVNTGESVLEAIALHSRYGFSFWDAMIIEAAAQGGCDILLSEDLSHGQVIEGVTIKNPFKD